MKWYLIVFLFCYSLYGWWYWVFFSYFYWPFVYLLWKNIYWSSLFLLKSSCFLFSYWIVGVFYIFWIFANTVFHPEGCLFQFLIVSFDAQKLVLLKSKYSRFFCLLLVLFLVSYLRVHCLTKVMNICPVFSSKSFIISARTLS